MSRPHTISDLRQMKSQGKKIAALTAWDSFSAAAAEAAEADIVLVGDSLAMTVQGAADTLSVTLDEMIYHTRLVAGASETPFIFTDMPFMTYQVSAEQALVNSGRVLKEGRSKGVKLEGGHRMAATVEKITGAGIPVMGHIGLTPQAVHELGGYKVQGKTVESARVLIEDARALQEAGACAIVLECVPGELAAHISAELTVPVIGIGSGSGCDGEIQVTADLLGLGDRIPRHAKRYVDLKSVVQETLKAYVQDVRSGEFPGDDQTVGADTSLKRALEADEL